MQTPSKIELDIIHTNWVISEKSLSKTYYLFIPATIKEPEPLCIIYKYDEAGNLISTERKKYKVTTGKGRFVIWLNDDEFFIDISDTPNPDSFILTLNGVERKFLRTEKHGTKE